jgi:hypothetical protein
VARGRAASVVTVATTQMPSADVVPTFLRETRASRRMVGLPRFVAEELAAHLAGPGDPEVFVFTARQGGPLRVTGSGLGCGGQPG